MEKKVLGTFVIILAASVSGSIIGTYYITNQFSKRDEQFLGAISTYYIYQILTAWDTPGWTEEFRIEDCVFNSTGNNTFFILQIGFQLILESSDGAVMLNMTVLNQTEMVGSVECRVVIENETENGKIVEVSLNFFAIDEITKSVFYFGENVSNFINGSWVSSAGAWRADQPGNRPGMIMPGVALVGAKYYQEIAPGEAMDRAEIMRNNDTVTVPAGTFEKCLYVRESTPLEPYVFEYKSHAPGIGVIIDEDLKLTQYGFL